MSNDFSKNHFLKVKGFCTFIFYHETRRRKTAATSRENSKDTPNVWIFGCYFFLLLKKATQNNRKQHKSTIDSNTNQHDNKSVRRQWSMGHPIALISQQIRYGLKLAKHWPKIGQQRSSIGFILYLEMWEQRFVSGALLSLMLSSIGGVEWWGGSCRQIGIIQIVKRKAGVYYTKTRLLWCILHHPKYVSYHIIFMVIVVTGKNSLGMKPQCLCKRRRGVTCIAYQRRMMPDAE